jgi:adenylate kinase
MPTIIITGTPGTGKSSLAKKLCSKFKFKYINVNNIIQKSKAQEGYDEKRKTKIINVDKLIKSLVDEIKNSKIKSKGIIIDSHLSHDIPAEYVDLCIVTRCSLKDLYKRLKNRRYPESKIRENIEAEIFEICSLESKKNNHKIIEIDTTKSLKIDKLTRIIKWIIKQKS